jgi:hypothetical protein
MALYPPTAESSLGESPEIEPHCPAEVSIDKL